MGNGWSVGPSEHTHLSIKFAVLHGCGLWHPKTTTIVTSRSLISAHHNRLIIMKKSEKFQELPKCGTEV